MKKSLITFLLISLAGISAFAQDSTVEDGKFRNKKGLVVTPEAGDYAIGISASPFFNYLGNFFNDNNYNNAPGFGFTAQNPASISGKYFLSDETAIRASVRLGFSSNTEKFVNAIDDEKVDEVKISAVNIGIKAGIEKNKSIRGRLRGFYGAELGIGVSPYSGEDVSGEAVVGNVSFTDGEESDNNYEEKGGRTLTFGVNGFVGVEYFFAPKISLGGEFGWGIGVASQNERVYEPAEGDNVTLDLGEKSFGFDNNASGSLVLHFYF